jgi:hypothetical protein
VLAVAGPITASASSTRPATLPRGVKAVQINQGEKTSLFSSFQPLAASSGGAVLLEQHRLGSGLLSGSSFYTWRTGSTKPVAFVPPPGGEALGQPSVVGSMVTAEYYANSVERILYRNIATNKSGSAAIAVGSNWYGSSSTGWLLVPAGGTSLADYDVATKASTTLATFPSGISQVLAGPSGVLVTTGDEIRYVTYAHRKVTTVVSDTSGSSYTCASMTTNAAGCLLYNETTFAYSVARLSLRGGKARVTKLPATVYTVAVVTPRSTGWLNCGTGTKCILERQPAAGGKPVAIKLPRVMGGNYGLVSSGDNFIYGRLQNASAQGGLFALADTSKKPKLLVGAPPSPLAAGVVSLSSTSVAWADNSKSGIAVYTRPITASKKGVAFGTSKLLAESGFVTADASAFSLSLSDAGSEVAYSDYLKQPATDPMGLDLDDNGKITRFSSVAGYFSFSLAYSPTAGPQVSVAGHDIVFETATDTFILYNASTHKSCTLPANAAYAVGNGPKKVEMVEVATDGAVYQESPVCSPKSPKQILPPLSDSGTVYSVGGLGIAGNYIGWSYSSSAGTVAQWVSRKGGGVKSLKNESTVIALVVSATDIGVTTYSNGATALYGVSLAKGTETLLATASYDLSVGKGVAAWINQTSSTPYAGKI